MKYLNNLPGTGKICCCGTFIMGNGPKIKINFFVNLVKKFSNSWRNLNLFIKDKVLCILSPHKVRKCLSAILSFPIGVSFLALFMNNAHMVRYCATSKIILKIFICLVFSKNYLFILCIRQGMTNIADKHLRTLR